MIVIGISGGVASGKSVIAQQLVKLGAHLVDGDVLGHQVLQQPEVIAAARDRWGDAVIQADGKIDRAAVAARVFGGNDQSAAELAYWESWTHPRITAKLKSLLADMAKDPNSIVVLDAPVMFKAGWDKLCDHLIFVDVPREIRRERALKRPGWNPEQFAVRENSQLPIEEKKKRASIVIDNSGSLEKTYQQVLNFWKCSSL